MNRDSPLPSVGSKPNVAQSLTLKKGAYNSQLAILHASEPIQTPPAVTEEAVYRKKTEYIGMQKQQPKSLKAFYASSVVARSNASGRSGNIVGVETVPTRSKRVIGGSVWHHNNPAARATKMMRMRQNM